MPRRKPDLAELEARLGHAFADRSLLERALTHASGGEAGSSNQRLEFLGDRVLGLATADMLFEAFPEADEGELSHRLSGLVRREACAAMATEWDIAAHLVVGASARHSGARRSGTVIADTAEAVIGAVYLDGGYPAARALVERSIAGRLRALERPPHDPKTALNEWALGGGRGSPTYAIVSRSGPDHAPLFTVAVRIGGLDEARGSGRSKRAAEQDAAESVLRREGVWTTSDHAA